MDDAPFQQPTAKIAAATQSAAASTRRVVIVGAGFAGIEVAKALQNAPADVVLVDRYNYTLFQPLLYQVATAALSPADVAVPIRALLHAPNIEILLDEVVGVDLEACRVHTSSKRHLDYDFLVLAPGSRFNYFGHEDWADLAPSPKRLSDAIEIRRRLLVAFERAEMCQDEEERRALMTFVVVGAGPTGVEMAGAIAELAKASLRRDFRRIDPAAAKILLVKAGSQILGSFPEKLRRYAQKALTQTGVEILLNMKVDHLDSCGIVAGHRRIAARTVIWAAGVRAELAAWLGARPGRHGGVKVNSDFSVGPDANVFVIGDAAEATGPDHKPLPGLAALPSRRVSTYAIY